jgi:Flp pilus assembly pilin Flp
MLSTQLSYVRLLVQVLRAQGKKSDRGASAIEWAVITAIIVGIATGIALVIGNAVSNHAAKIQ